MSSVHARTTDLLVRRHDRDRLTRRRKSQASVQSGRSTQPFGIRLASLQEMALFARKMAGCFGVVETSLRGSTTAVERSRQLVRLR